MTAGTGLPAVCFNETGNSHQFWKPDESELAMNSFLLKTSKQYEVQAGSQAGDLSVCRSDCLSVEQLAGQIP